MARGIRLWRGRGWLWRSLLTLFVLLVPAPILLLLVFRFVPIPGTPELFPHAAIEAATRVGKPTATAAAGALKAAPKDWRAARAAAYRPAA